MKKLALIFSCIFLSSIQIPVFANAIHCPSLFSVKAAGWSGAREDTSEPGQWSVFCFSSYYDTTIPWSFLITNVSVSKTQDVFFEATAALDKLALYAGPEKTEKDELLCIYTGPNRLTGMAISPPNFVPK